MNFPSCPNKVLQVPWIPQCCSCNFCTLESNNSSPVKPVLTGLNRFISFTLKRERFLKIVGCFKDLSIFTRFSKIFAIFYCIWFCFSCCYQENFDSAGSNKLRLRLLRHCRVSNARDEKLLSCLNFQACTTE